MRLLPKEVTEGNGQLLQERGIPPARAAYRNGAEAALCFYGRSLERR